MLEELTITQDLLVARADPVVVDQVVLLVRALMELRILEAEVVADLIVLQALVEQVVQV